MSTFICYAHEDTRFALKLAQALVSHGAAVWVDQWHARRGENWERSILNALRDCTHFLVVLSPAAVDSWLVRDQTALALRYNKSIVFVLGRSCELPSPVEDRPMFDLSGDHFKAGLDQLLAELRGQAGEPSVDAETTSSKLEDIKMFLGRHPVWAVVVLVLLLLIGSGVYFWRRPRTESAAGFSLSEVEPVHLDEPIFVPTVELLAPANSGSAPVDIRRRLKDGKLMVFVPAGDFLMGSSEADPNADEDEKPRHLVYLCSYWIDRTEVTTAEYRRCVEAGRCSPGGLVSATFIADDLPVVGVNWQQASSYCTWVGARLPTEAEWEKAARGIDGRIYPWGGDFDGSRLNYCDANCVADWRDFDGDDGYRYTAPVGSFPTGVSPFGALDMSGNVWEWTADWYEADWYHRSPYKNPTGPQSGVQRVIRGGSWLYPAESVRVARRHRDVPTSRYDNIGFRCVVSDRDEQGE